MLVCNIGYKKDNNNNNRNNKRKTSLYIVKHMIHTGKSQRKKKSQQHRGNSLEIIIK